MKTKKINGKNYVSVYEHRLLDIWALREANPTDGDELCYLVESLTGIRFFNTVSEAIAAIDNDWK